MILIPYRSLHLNQYTADIPTPQTIESSPLSSANLAVSPAADSPAQPAHGSSHSPAALHHSAPRHPSAHASPKSSAVSERSRHRPPHSSSSGDLGSSPALNSRTMAATKVAETPTPTLPSPVSPATDAVSAHMPGATPRGFLAPSGSTSRPADPKSRVQSHLPFHA